MIMENEELYLEHFGKKGMRWGSRSATPTPAKKERKPSADHRRVSDLRTRPNPTLTNKQLKDVNMRLSLVKTKNQLDPGKAAIGKSFAKEILDTGKVVVGLYALSTTPLGKKAIAAGKQVMTDAKTKQTAANAAKAAARFTQTRMLGPG